MDELKKGLGISMRGASAAAALARFKKQIALWGIALPKVKPLVLDFGLGEFEATGLIEYWIANEARAGYCGKYLFVFDGQTCPEHGHRTKHETFFIVKGRVRMRLAGKTRLMKEGDVLPVPPGQRHAFSGQGPALLLELSMPCEIDDNVFTNTRIPMGSAYRRMS
jgi:quercetin dioxygenase-like cupin family protein